MKKNFTQRLASLSGEALRAINSTNVGTLVLATGEKAVDNDDAWLIIGRPDGVPVLRNKKEQRRIEVGLKPGYFPDVPLSGRSVEDICELADRLS